MNVFVASFNRFTYTKKLCEDLEAIGLTPIIIDNLSTYPPLLEWYKQCKYKIHYLNQNLIGRALWTSGVINEYPDRFYLSTVCDIDISNVPKDVVEVMHKVMDANPDVYKVGLSLEINDLPDNAYTKEIIAHETQFWQNKIEGGFIAPIDNGLSLYDKERKGEFMNAIRLDRPYTCRHYDWYLTPETITEEDVYYMEHTKWFGWQMRWKQLMTLE